MNIKSRGIKIAASASLAAAMLGTAVFSAAPAHAADTQSYTLSAAEVSEKARMADDFDALCNGLPGFVGVACALDNSREFQDKVREADSQNKALKVEWRATGSSLSYDKAEYEYTVV